MDYTQSPGYPANAANIPRQCDLNPGLYNQQGASYPIPRPYYHYDPVHDHSNYNNPMSNVRNNRGNHDNVFAYGSPYFQHNLPLTNGSSSHQMGNYGQFNPYAQVADMQQRNNGFQSQYQPVPYPPAPYGAIPSEIPISNPPSFGTRQRLPITNAMSQQQTQLAMWRQLEQERSNLQARIQAHTTAYIHTSNALRGDDERSRRYNSGVTANTASDGRLANSGTGVSQSASTQANLSSPTSQSEQRNGPASMHSSPNRPRAVRHGSNVSDSSGDEEFEASASRFQRQSMNDYSLFMIRGGHRAEVIAAMQAYTAAPVKPKISKAALESLIVVTKEELEAEGEEPQCIICYNDFGLKNPEGITEQPLRLPKCRHVFGDVCIKQWLEDNSTCPYCRDKLPVETSDARSRAIERLMLIQATSSHSQAPRRARERAENRYSEPSAHVQQDERQRSYFRAPVAIASSQGSPRRAHRSNRAPITYGGLEFPPIAPINSPASSTPASSTQAGNSNQAASQWMATPDSAVQRSGNSPAVAVGSTQVTNGQVSPQPRMSGAPYQTDHSRSYSSGDSNRHMYSRNSSYHENRVESSTSSHSRTTSDFGTNTTTGAVFGPSDRQLAMGSPTPIPRHSGVDFLEYQTQAPWRDSQSPSSTP